MIFFTGVRVLENVKNRCSSRSLYSSVRLGTRIPITIVALLVIKNALGKNDRRAE